MKNMKEYMKARYHKRRQEALAKLGNACVNCGNTNRLEIDHIDRNKKAFSVSRLWSCRKDKYDAEIAKCQLLCQDCHKAKTLCDLNQTNAKNTHGTLSSYRYCKCVLCKKAKSDWMKQYRQRKGT